MAGRFEYSAIPAYTKEALDRYEEQHLRPGGFLTAVLEGDLFGAVARADDTNLAALAPLVVYVYSEVHAPTGYRGCVEKWCNQKEYNG